MWEAYNKLQRAKEQKVKVQQDAAAFVRYYQRLSQQLGGDTFPHTAWLHEHAAQVQVQAGLQALKLRGTAFAQLQLQIGSELQQRIGHPPAEV